MSDTFHRLLDEASELHMKKGHDYAPLSDPYGNYHFAGKMAHLFLNPDDSGFVGRLGEKIFRLANLENNCLSPMNEAVEDTEIDILVITALWISDRRDRRNAKAK